MGCPKWKAVQKFLNSPFHLDNNFDWLKLCLQARMKNLLQREENPFLDRR